jgi:hypothetical protein
VACSISRQPQACFAKPIRRDRFGRSPPADVPLETSRVAVPMHKGHMKKPFFYG